MGITKEQFIKEFKRRLTDEYALDVKDATPEELYQTLAAVVKSGYSDIWRKTWKNYIKEGLLFFNRVFARTAAQEQPFEHGLVRTG